MNQLMLCPEEIRFLPRYELLYVIELLALQCDTNI